MSARRAGSGWPELALWIGAATLLTVWSVWSFDLRFNARRDLERFAVARVEASAGTQEPDLSLWSPARISAWRAAQSRAAPVPLAVLRIPRLGIEVAVLEGTDDVTLDRAVGHIEGTAPPGAGNFGIAGHRDGFFRGLKDIRIGDRLELQTLSTTAFYRVDRTWIVDPEDVSVLDPTPAPTVTLVTCYPFYFVGSAPRRFIVRAVPAVAPSS